MNTIASEQCLSSGRRQQTSLRFTNNEQETQTKQFCSLCIVELYWIRACHKFLCFPVSIYFSFMIIYINKVSFTFKVFHLPSWIRTAPCLAGTRPVQRLLVTAVGMGTRAPCRSSCKLSLVWHKGGLGTDIFTRSGTDIKLVMWDGCIRSVWCTATFNIYADMMKLMLVRWLAVHSALVAEI